MLLVSGSTKTTARISDPRLGSLLRPGNGNRPGATPWAIDNGAYAGFEEAAFVALLERCVGVPGCLWVAAPDVVAHAAPTLESFARWEPRIRAMGYPVALVAQDGLIEADVPWDRLDCLFIGGTTEFKLGRQARALAREAKRRGKLVHMGRVNTIGRAAYAQSIGCDSIDGTAFSRYGDIKIPWMLRELAALDSEGNLFERLERHEVPS